jgi:ATP-dependent exoDNAse (exonuclease V) beta subunit
VAEYLRREGGLPALAESDLRVGTDNPLGAALLALVQGAAHPGDTMAREHVMMTPLGTLLAHMGLTTPEAVCACVLQQIHDDGFERTMEFWVGRLEAALPPDDAFSRERGRQLVAAAALFDATGSREVAEFVAFVQRHTVRGAEVGGVIRVMTIHKSKGLGFDVVVLPDLEGQRIDQRREGLAVQRAPDREVEWVLDLPTKLFWTHEETLSAHVAAAEAEAGYEALALLYVGLTRAKRAMYVITEPPGKSESRNYPKLLTATLGSEEWSAGDVRWYETLPVVTAPVASGFEAEEAVMRERVPRRPARRPSAENGGVVEAGQLLAIDGIRKQAAAFGTAVHALLAGVESGQEFATGATAWADWPPEVWEEVAACLRAPALAHVWRQPQWGEVWSERAFEIVLDGAWVTGVFDRVVLERLADGRVQAVTVYDFKTDRVEGDRGLAAAVARHARQLNLYRRVAGVLTGVPAGTVRVELVFTALRKSVEVPES